MKICGMNGIVLSGCEEDVMSTSVFPVLYLGSNQKGKRYLGTFCVQQITNVPSFKCALKFSCSLYFSHLIFAIPIR